jgi:hypothetical protein
MNGANPIARLVSEAADYIYNTLNARTVDLYFQRSPGRPSGDPRGIANLEYRITSNGAVLRAATTTGNDGKVTVRVRGQSVTVELLQAGTPVASFEVRTTQAGFGPVTDVEGQKQRLRFLGYQIGHAGPAGDGVDNVQNMEFERSVLDLQADAGLLVDANRDATVQNQLTTQAGA